MSHWFSKEQRHLLRLSGLQKNRFPVPTRMISNGEYMPLPQTPEQKMVEKEIQRLSDAMAAKTGVDRRRLLRTSAGYALAFAAMNTVYGQFFDVARAELSDPEVSDQIRAALADQFIFDVQTHFVSDDYDQTALLDLRRYAGTWNPQIDPASTEFSDLQFDNYLKEVFLDSDTTLALLSGAPADIRENWFVSNDEIAKARATVNAIAGAKRLFAHAIFTPGQPGWLDEIDRAVSELRPDSWKGYTVGDPLAQSAFPYRLDDEELLYPAYEKFVKAGIRNVCIHKGLLPENYLDTFPETWTFAKVDDVGPAARDWPELNFIIYHSGLKPINGLPQEHLSEFERSGRIDWVSDLADIPQKYGVSNVYAEIGTTFASSAVAHPRHAAGLIGILVKGMGADHVLWGTDSVWYGSPQWQIEALRRLRMPEDLMKKFGLPDLGPADGPLKSKIFGKNAAPLYGLNVSELMDRDSPVRNDRLSEKRRQYAGSGGRPSHRTYGFMR